MVANATGLPVGELDTLFCPTIKSMTEIGMGSNTAPTTGKRLFGLRVFNKLDQSNGTLTVTISKSNEFAAFARDVLSQINAM